jgi:hypothetical protein
VYLYVSECVCVCVLESDIVCVSNYVLLFVCMCVYFQLCMPKYLCQIVRDYFCISGYVYLIFCLLFPLNVGVNFYVMNLYVSFSKFLIVCVCVCVCVCV